MYAFLLALAVLGFASAAWKDRRLGLSLVAAALPTYLLRFSVGPIPFTLLETLILTLVGVWIARGDWKRVASIPRPWLYGMGGLLAAAILATAIAPDLRGALGALRAYFIEPALLFLVAATTLKTEADRRALIAWFVGGAAFASLVGVFQFATGMGIPIPWDLERRVTGPFPYPNALGLYAGPAAILAVLFAARETGKARLAWAAGALLCFTGIVLAQSEAAVGSVLAMLFLASLFSKPWRRISLVATAAGFLLVVSVSPLRNFAMEKLSLHDRSGDVRRMQWSETWEMLKTRPVFGAGLNGYPAALVPFHRRPDIEIFQYPHTMVLNVWTELGLAGFAACAGLFALVWAALRRAQKDRWSDTAAVAVLLAFGGMLIHGLVDVPYFKNDLSALTWLLLALLCTAYGTRARSRA